MEDLRAEVVNLRAENARLLEELQFAERGSSLFLVLLCFIISIVVAVLISFQQELLRLWRHYADIMLVAPHTPADRAHRIHDNFNLLVLPGVVLLDFRFILSGKLELDENPHFWNFLWFTVTYVAIDMVWVAMIPQCVKSQATILIHHAVTLLYMGIPGFNPATRYAMAVCLLVEVNTWFLILRRSPIAQSSLLRPSVSICFYVTWYVIRIGVYPYMIYDVYQLFTNHVETMKKNGDPAWVRASYGMTYMVIPPLFQTALSALNIHWTIQLVKNTWKKRGPEKGL
mmetsp:Transcript_13024/g.37112  ORF Transcript_13024/g.37112 Transcript_13024/m.37112 type:complete len:285 (-) Transcript_13024:50-904(-)